jgi:hypothetical protein
VQLPSKEDVARAVESFNEEWGAVDEVLYTFCWDHPDHTSLRHVMAKVVLVGRGYAAGIERCVQPPGGEQAIVLVGRFLHDHAAVVDEIIAAVRQSVEPLDAEGMTVVVREHGRLTTLLASMPQCSRSPRSFASKYLHFHHPVVPIFDAYAADRLARTVPWSSSDVPFGRPDGADPEYWQFCCRFFRLLATCRQRGVDVTVKSLDAYLWQVPVPRARR